MLSCRYAACLVKARSLASSETSKDDGYLARSKRPLEMLLFLLPFIAFYEYELTRALRVDDGVITNAAHLGLLRFLSAFGSGDLALSLPAMLLVVCLLLWHTLLRADWKVDLSIIARMWLESAALAVPVLVLSSVIGVYSASESAAASVEGWDALTLPAQIAVSIGAGLYEELVFRMMLILALHALLKDALAVPDRAATIVAVTASACLFAIYHPVDPAEVGNARMARFVFLLGAGLFWALLFLWRGFGIAAGSHMLYDVAASLLDSSSIEV